VSRRADRFSHRTARRQTGWIRRLIAV